MLFLLSHFLVVLSFQYGKAYVAPVLSVCSRSNPNMEKCITNAVYRIRQNVANGDYGDGRSATRLDPIYFDKLAIVNGQGLRLILTNVTIQGASGFEIKKIRDHLAERKFDIVSKIPVMQINGKYDLDMNVLLMKTTGKGHFNLVLNDTIANMLMEYQVAPVGGKNFIRFNPIDLKLKFGKARFNLTGLFSGDPTLEQVGNRVINENPNLLLDEVKPVFEANLGRIFTDISNSVVQGAEESELLPP
ncbi:uncharacterized protein LOC131682126 [Topomyia yanbarensis]|uniref:uncharacterized protein LOC131682126 n=1 Tax=Topomyia yanbarensis TaxID=2498891 RepID=UPI00273B6AB0|nr:uncharacterized protein LOC131682126 [Topomyia yanbarensis]